MDFELQELNVDPIQLFLSFGWVFAVVFMIMMFWPEICLRVMVWSINFRYRQQRRKYKKGIPKELGRTIK